MQDNDLISRAALLEAMPKNDEILSFEVRRVICNAPTVYAVKVVRCNMCAHYETDTGYCYYYDTGRDWDDYCSRGVKR